MMTTMRINTSPSKIYLPKPKWLAKSKSKKRLSANMLHVEREKREVVDKSLVLCLKMVENRKGQS